MLRKKATHLISQTFEREINKMEIYTDEQWTKDRTFSAEVGQEVTEQIYNNLLNCMPPLRLPRETAKRVDMPIYGGFLMGEPNSHDNEGMLYLAFGMTEKAGEKHYYYLGLSHVR